MSPTLTQAFTSALTARGGIVHQARDRASARAKLYDLCIGPVVVDNDPLLTDLCTGLDQVDDPWQAAVGVTAVRAAAAATGTLVLTFDADHPRRTALVPPVHVAVVPVECLVATYADAVGVLHAVRPFPSGMRLITGPSSSGDIEMVPIRGMHGPVAVHAILLGD